MPADADAGQHVACRLLLTHQEFSLMDVHNTVCESVCENVCAHVMQVPPHTVPPLSDLCTCRASMRNLSCQFLRLHHGTLNLT